MEIHIDIQLVSVLNGISTETLRIDAMPYLESKC